MLLTLFSTLPKGEIIHYWFQKNVTRSLPTDDGKFIELAGAARKHLSKFTQYSSSYLNESIFFEFGAGWDLLIPLTLYALGVEKQILVDVRPLIRLELINDTIDKLSKLPIAWLYRRPFHRISKSTCEDLKRYYGIDYRAPCDARTTGLPSGTVHCITSTTTLEHIPEESIKDILNECHRILASDGVMSMTIDYTDHYASFDRRISKYNFLQYSSNSWSFYNPPLHYQNRLRHRNYLKLFHDAGFVLLEEQIINSHVADIQQIKQLSLDTHFKEFTCDELAIQGSSLVFRKKDRKY